MFSPLHNFIGALPSSPRGGAAVRAPLTPPPLLPPPVPSEVPAPEPEIDDLNFPLRFHRRSVTRVIYFCSLERLFLAGSGREKVCCSS